MPSGTSASISSLQSFSTVILDSKCYWNIFADLFVVVVIIVIVEVVCLTFAMTLIMASTFAVAVTVTWTVAVDVTGATSFAVVMAGAGAVADAVLSNVEVTDNLERSMFTCKQPLSSTPLCSGVNIQGGTLTGI